jgi:cell division protein FtsA
MKLTKNRETRSLIVGLDIGTSKTTVVVAEAMPEGRYQVIGLGQQPSRGLKRGVVVNIEATVDSIRRAVEEAELMANVRISEVMVSITGGHVKGVNSEGVVAIKDREVSSGDVEKVQETARAVLIPNDQQILHVLTQEYLVDSQGDIRDPVGMSGMRLEVKVHIVTGAVSAIQNVMKCVRRCGLEVRELVLQPLASADAVLTEDEKDLGVCLVDIGGGTTNVAVYLNGTVRHTAVIPIAGDQITNDVAMALRTPTRDAEEIKIHQGCALRSMTSSNQMIEVPAVGERGTHQASRFNLAEVIEMRVEEIFNMVQVELKRSEYESKISSGIVITGGSSALEGMLELGEMVFQRPVRIGQPNYHGALEDIVRTPRYAAAMGLIAHGYDQVRLQQQKRIDLGNMSGAVDRLKNWFKSSF